MSQQENCSICFEDYEDPVKLPCNHIFCRDCIVVALEQRQSCPICRRLCCNYINSPFLSITQPEGMVHEQEGDPCFIYRITIHHNAQAQFNFFEKRYVEMITEVLKKNLTFIIDPQYNDFCMRVKLIECVPVHQHSIYVCTVQNIQRLKIIGFSERNIKDSDSKLKYATTQSIIDNFDQETLIVYQKLHTCIEKIIQILSLNENAKSQLLALAGKKDETQPEKITKHSLELLQTIQMCENGLLKWYYSTDINGRLGVILKHYESQAHIQQLSKHIPDKRIHNYAFFTQAIIGRGSYGVVYIGRNIDSGQIVAFKAIAFQQYSSENQTLLQKEIGIMKDLDCHNIVRLIDVITTANNCYIISELCTGGDLKEYMKKSRPIEEQATTKILIQILRGILQSFAKRFDKIDEDLTTSLVGTPLYISPQVLLMDIIHIQM